jgi:hypothetical protein
MFLMVRSGICHPYGAKDFLKWFSTDMALLTELGEGWWKDVRNWVLERIEILTVILKVLNVFEHNL